jgi:ribonuclease P protein component
MYLDVRVMASPFEFSRVGIVVPRHQHSAVDRNRLKRRLRELVRLELLPTLRGRSTVDLAIRARREAYTVPLDRIRADIGTIRSRVTTGDAVA